MSRVLTNIVETIGETNFEDYWKWKQVTYVYWDEAESKPTVVVEIYYGNTSATKQGVMSIYKTTVTVDGVTKDNGEDFSLNVSCEPGQWQLMQTFEFPLTYTIEDNKTITTKHSGHFAGYGIQSKTTTITLTPPPQLIFSDSDKAILEQNAAAIKCKLIVKPTDTLAGMMLTESDSIKDWIYTDERYVPKQGFIGQFVARTLSGNLQNISDDFNIDGREIELQIGIVSSTGENWYSLGNFIVTDPTDNNVEDSTKFEAMDYAKLFNTKFNGDFKGTDFAQSYNEIITNKGSVTALWLAKYCCAQVGVEFGQTTFTNSDFVINQNPFQAGETCRDVLKEISKLAYSWVRIGWDNKCYIDFEPVSGNTVSTGNTITNDHYYSLKTRKEQYGPINNVVVGMSGIDGESHSEKDPNSTDEEEHTIYIYDNPLTNTFELRALAQKKANKLFGLKYAQVNTETTGHPWLQANEKINVKNMEGVSNVTYPFNRTITFNGHIRGTIDTMCDSEVESTLAYESDILKNIKQASINVDKQNGIISLLAKDVKETKDAVENIDGTINPVGKVEGEEIYITDASDKPLMNLQIDGKSTQEITTQSDNLCPPFTDSHWSFSGGAYVDTNGNLQMPNANSAASVDILWKKRSNTVAINVQLVTGGNLILGTQYLDSNKNLLSGNGSAAVDKADGFIHTTTFGGSNQYGDALGQSQYLRLMFHRDSTYAAQPYSLINPMVSVHTASYTPFIPDSPSPDYPSEINSVGYENLFNPNNLTDNVYVLPNGNMETQNSFWLSDYIEVNDNKPYVLNYIASGIIYYDENKNFIGINFDIKNFTTKNLTKYIRINYKKDIVTYENANTVMMNKGTKLLSYIPYGKYGIEVETTGRNIWDEQWELGTINANTGEDITVTTRIRSKNFINVKSDTKYYGRIPSTVDNCLIVYYDNAQAYIKSSYIYSDSYEFTTPSNCKYIKFTPASNYGTTYKNDICINISDDKNGEYTPYQSNTSTIVLNAPLRSLPNGVKDIAYIKNNKLYVDRYVGSVVLDGGEDWKRYDTNDSINQFTAPIENPPLYYGTSVINGDTLICDYFKSIGYGGYWNTTDTILFATANGIFIQSELSLDEFKTWLSTHNTQVDYELATPVTEEYELTEKPSTAKGVNNMYVNDEIKPVLHVEYVRDTTISDYVEQHVSELTMSGNEIKASVSSLEGVVITNKSEADKSVQGIIDKFDDYVPQSTYILLEKSVTQLQTDTYTKTEINTKLIDGSVTKVVTTSGTFDENGMHYEKTNAKTKTTINEVGVSVRDATGSVSKSLLFAGYVDNDNTEFPQYKNQTIVGSDNIVVREFLVIGDNSRIQDYEDGGGIFIL